MLRKYKIRIHKEHEGTYAVSVPVSPGCLTYGETIGHAMEMGKKAIELYFEKLQKRGEEIPDDSENQRDLT